MSKQIQKIMATSVLALFPLVSQALPIDWHGSFGVDTTLINDFRRIKSKTAVAATDASQEVALAAGNKANASWQSYILKLSPTMVINDAATFFGELTTGYANGGFLGDSAQTNSGTTNAGALYPQNQAAGQAINLKKAYLEIYSDTATYVLGRHTYNWGLGAIYNDGKDTWNRHAYSRDGITMKLKVGNFHLSPFWSKVSNISGVAPTTTPGFTDPSNAKEIGTGLLYDNPERDISFGMLYGKKSTEANNAFYGAASELTVTDLYFKKIFGKFDLTVEAPLMSGDLGNVSGYAPGTKMSYSAKAFILQSNYKMSDAWTIGLDAGQVSGQGDDTGKFSALYLNPNYQVANLLFRYNLSAVSDGAQSIYDSYLTNARYFKLRSTYNSEKWTFDYALIMATAMEVAEAGKNAYNHTKFKTITNSNTTQSNSLGTEVDVNARYQWNKEISIGSSLGYLITGDYFAYTNDATKPNEAQSSYVLQLNAAVSF
jgi:hypothetical protein